MLELVARLFFSCFDIRLVLHYVLFAIQLIQGAHGLKPTEPVINFISKYHTHFTGGIFWYNGTNAQLVKAATENIRKVGITII